MDIADGYLIVVKEDCPTCVEIVPALQQLVTSGIPLTIASQDDPAFPPAIDVVDDRELELSWRLDVEVTPTVIEIVDGAPQRRIVGWRRSEWESFLGVEDLGPGLPEWRPGCGSRSVEPGMPERLAARYDGAGTLLSRRIELGGMEDEHEALYARGWSDGLPLVPPTPERVLRMLGGTSHSSGDVVAVLPPDYREATVEKVAVNAVMAGCLPEYLPIVLAAVAGVATEEFNLHGVAATTWYSGPIVVVNGPIADRVGMNWGLNAFGPGNRANATIGRALNLVIRNIGGSRPGGVDRSTQGHPAKYTMAFAEREHDSPWPSLASERGIPDGTSAVTLFAGQGPAPMADQLSRDADSLARSLASSLRVVHHTKAVGRVAALVAISPEHAGLFAAAGWTKARLRSELITLLTIPGEELVRGYGGMAVGVAGPAAETPVPKFTPDNLWFVHVGSTAGGSSGIMSGWVSGPKGSRMATIPIEES